MKLQHLIILTVLEYVYSHNPSEQLQRFSRSSSNSKFEQPTPARYKYGQSLPISSLEVTQDIKDGFFPDVEYPTSVLESQPFYFTPNNVLLDPFNDDVKSTFKSITENTKTKTNDAVSKSIFAENPILLTKDNTPEKEEVSLPVEEDIKENSTKSNEILQKNASIKDKSDRDGADLNKQLVIGNDTLSEESEVENISNLGNVIFISENMEVSPFTTTESYKTNEQFEEQIPMPMLLSETGQPDIQDALQDEKNILLGVEDILSVVNNIVSDNSTTDENYYYQQTSEISTSEFVLQKPPTDFDDFGNEQDVKVSNEEEYPFYAPVCESSCMVDNTPIEQTEDIPVQ